MTLNLETLSQTLNKSCSKASDSSCFTPMIRFVKPGLIYNAFCPVA